MFDDDLDEILRDVSSLTGINDTIKLNSTGQEYEALVDDDGIENGEQTHGVRETGTINVVLRANDFLNETNWPAVRDTFVWSRNSKRYEIRKVGRDRGGAMIELEAALANRSKQ